MKNWKILIVDDEKDIHDITRLTLKRLKYKGRGVEFISAMSASEAKEQLQLHKDIALVLLDVVMEEDDSGLALVKYIRKDLKDNLVQIIIRTGHPGQAPEESVTFEYEINDYQEKSELTSSKLKTSVVTALRAYQALYTVFESKKGLRKVIESSAEIFKNQSDSDFNRQVLKKMLMITMHTSEENASQYAGILAYKVNGTYRIATGIGLFEGLENKPLIESADLYVSGLGASIESVIANHNDCIFDQYRVLWFKNGKEQESIIIIEEDSEAREWNSDLIEAFRLNIIVAFDNKHLYNEIEASQHELFYSLGQIAESRSRETGNHVKRVGEIAKQLGILLGYSHEDAERLRLAATVHDLGKLSIPDYILNKPGKLTVEEYDIMKTHATIGYDMLNASDKELLKSAAFIAKEHHENYDGTGYPDGLKGDEIGLSSRIVAIADVFDALGNKRVYKNPWQKEQILEYMREETGRKFDPDIMERFFEHVDDLLRIREQFPD